MKTISSLLAVLLVAACSGGGAGGGSSPATAANLGGSTPGSTGGSSTQGCMPASTPAPTPTPGGPAPAGATGLTVPSGFTIQIIGIVSGARELAALPNGDLLVATGGTTIYIIPNATGTSNAGNPQVFTSINDSPDAGIAFSLQQCAVYVGTQYGVYKIPYTIGDQIASSSPQKIASVRSGTIAPNSDGDVHHTTSVAITAASSQTLYASIGSSCNACTEVDPTRASIQQMSPSGSGMTARATRIRNAIAVTIDPATGHLWAGNAGQDNLPTNHPYEFLDDVSSHSGVADYGWPNCEENHVAYVSGSQCANTVAPLIEFPAYSTLIGDAFYPSQPQGTYAFPSQYRGGIFVTRHGSWHTPNGCNVLPEVDFVPMNGATPKTPVNWNDPTVQWQAFVTGFQPGCSASTRIGRPTGITVAADGSLFVADDQTGNIYRIRY
jgi:glucose/arabinose dehydrogenase